LLLLFLLAGIGTAAELKYELVPKEVLASRLQQADESNPVRKDRLHALFTESGCGALQEQSVSKKGLPNVICTLPGSTGRVIIVGAHFDSRGPGVSDNWSGAVLLPALYQSLSQSPRRHTFIFIGFTDEEKGLIGSRHYAKKLTPDERKQIDAVVNMDTLGLSPTNVWVSRSDKALVDWLAAAADSQKLPLSGVEIAQVGSTDSESFAPLNLARITVSSVTQETLGILHSKMDTFDKIQMKNYYETYRLLAFYLVVLDQKLSPP